MKSTRFFALFLALACTLPLSAQHFERTLDLGFYNKVYDLLADPNGDLLLITVGAESSSLERFYATRIDTNGDTQSFPLSPAGYLLDFDILPLPGGYVVFTEVFECDIFFPRQIRFLDLNGQEVWSRPISYFQIGIGDDLSFLPAPDSTFWIFRHEAPPLRVGLNGTVIDNGANLPVLPPFDQYFITPGHQYIVNGFFGLARYDATLTSVLSDPAQLSLLDVAQLDNGELIGVDGTFLRHLDTNLNLIDSKWLSPNFGFPQVAVAGSTIWVLKPGAKVGRFGLELLPQQVFEVLHDDPFKPVLLAAGSDRLLLAGEERLSTNSIGSTGPVVVRSTPPGAPYFYGTTDAGLSAISVGSVLGSTLSPSIAYEIIFQEVHVTVTNYGDAPLEEVTIKGVLGSVDDICLFEYQVWETFTGLNVAPGASIELDLDTLYTLGQFALPPTVELCLFTLLPNDSLDRNHDNNESCQSFTVTVATREPAPAGLLKISPNPAGAQCRVSWDEAIGQPATARLIDATGRVVFAETLTTNEWDIRREQLPSGLYRAVLRLGNGRLLVGSLVFK